MIIPDVFNRRCAMKEQYKGLKDGRQNRANIEWMFGHADLANAADRPEIISISYRMLN
jgi:hypothetical protein